MHTISVMCYTEAGSTQNTERRYTCKKGSNTAAQQTGENKMNLKTVKVVDLMTKILKAQNIDFTMASEDEEGTEIAFAREYDWLATYYVEYDQLRVNYKRTGEIDDETEGAIVVPIFNIDNFETRFTGREYIVFNFSESLKLMQNVTA